MRNTRFFLFDQYQILNTNTIERVVLHLGLLYQPLSLFQFT